MTVAGRVKEELGIDFSQDFEGLILAGEAIVTILDAIRGGQYVSEEDISFVVEFLGQSVAIVAMKYDPKLTNRKRY